jgi:amino acid transporter
MSDVFIRKASGLTRVIGPWDALAFTVTGPGLMYMFLHIVWTAELYPGVDMRIACVVGLLLMEIPATLYALLAIAMPRSGGEYVWVSRTLSPAWGFAAGWAISIVGFSWSGSVTPWATTYGLDMAFRSLAVGQSGASFVSNPYWILANTLDTPTYNFILDTILIISMFAIIFRGARASVKLFWAGLFAGLLGLFTFYAGVLTSGGFPAFVQRFNEISGSTYQTVIDQATKGLTSQGFAAPGTYLIWTSVGAGITYVTLNSLGNTYLANIMGEVKEIRKSALLGMLLPCLAYLLLWEIFFQFAYAGFSGAFWGAAGYFAPGGVGAGTGPTAVFSVIPMANFMLAFINPNVGFAVLCSLCFFFTSYASNTALAFGPIRNIFAYSFDRMLPTYFAKTDKRGSPWAATILGFVFAEIFCVVSLLPISTWIAYSIMGWFFAWLIVGIAAMVLPFTARGKQIFDKAPEIVKKKIAGFPILSLLGLLTFLISVMMEYFTFLPFLLGIASSLYIWITISFFILPSFVIYYISKAYHGRKGVRMELQFKEIPPD